MHFLVSKLFFPVAVLGSFSIFLFTRHVEGNLEAAIFLPAIFIILAATYLERKTPFRKEWNNPRGDRATDLTSTGIAMLVTEPLLKLLASLIVVAVFELLPIQSAFQIFPSGLPFVMQVLVAAVIAEFGSYWMHRWHHSNPRLWWLHALHHGSRRLYTINNFRVHPLNHMLNSLAGLLPLMVIGAPADAILGYLALTSPVVLLQHANLPFRNGYFNYLFSTNEVHRWHHSTLPDEANRNFGRALVIWDHVFGTFRYRRHSNEPLAVGLFPGEPYPSDANYARQVMSMFCWKSCHSGCCPVKGVL